MAAEMHAPSLAHLTKVRLMPHERAWLEQILAAILPGELAGLPAFGGGNRSEFVRAIEDAPGPSFLPGLRMMVYALNLLPLGFRGYRRPFFALTADRQRAFVADLAKESGYMARQLIATMKVLAAFAYFEDPSVRARFDLTPMVRP
jgi:hypothetical protein